MPALNRRSAISVLSAGLASGAARAQRKPNVLVVISDQLHHGALEQILSSLQSLYSPSTYVSIN